MGLPGVPSPQPVGGVSLSVFRLREHAERESVFRRPLSRRPAARRPLSTEPPAALSPEVEDAIAARYRVGHALGHGGMSSVYLADDLKHGRKVAVKIMRPEMGVSLAAERFEREIAVTARLSHPNILPLHDSGDA